MKYILLVGDGMADRPLEELNGRTVLEVADTRYMDKIVATGRIGIVNTIPHGMVPASDVANLSIMGYDPKLYYKGRGPLEAANMGIELKDTDVAFRCNTVTVNGDTMIDYSAGHISTKESSILIEHLDKVLSNDFIKFYPGIGYRHLMILDASSKETAEELCKVVCVPPHDILGKKVSKNLPRGKGAEVIIDLMERSKVAIQNHDVNRVRVDLKENPANMIWLWGQGVKPDMPTFKKLFKVNGSVISAVDLVNGIGKIVGLEVIKVPGATGYYDTNFKGKAQYALESLKEKDFVFVHVEAPDEAGHNGDVRAKITAIENFDRHVVGTIWKAMSSRKDFRIMVLPDHATPISVRSHTNEAVPFAISGKDVVPDDACVFTEKAARSCSFTVKCGSHLMKYLINMEKVK